MNIYMAQYLTRQSDELAAHDSIYKHLNKVNIK